MIFVIVTKERKKNLGPPAVGKQSIMKPATRCSLIMHNMNVAACLSCPRIRIIVSFRGTRKKREHLRTSEQRKKRCNLLPFFRVVVHPAQDQTIMGMLLCVPICCCCCCCCCVGWCRKGTGSGGGPAAEEGRQDDGEGWSEATTSRHVGRRDDSSGARLRWKGCGL